jgi:hypothetical protein
VSVPAKADPFEWWAVIVRPSVLNAPHQREELLDAFELQFSQPVVLMAQEWRGMPTYWGRSDVADHMAQVPLERSPGSVLP